jgi:hypothetical protein
MKKALRPKDTDRRPRYPIEDFAKAPPTRLCAGMVSRGGLRLLLTNASNNYSDTLTCAQASYSQLSCFILIRVCHESTRCRDIAAVQIPWKARRTKQAITDESIAAVRAAKILKQTRPVV